MNFGTWKSEGGKKKKNARGKMMIGFSLKVGVGGGWWRWKRDCGMEGLWG